MHELLTSAGLTETQAAVYLYLLENSDSSPPVVARKLSLTRTNAYKVLDGLIEQGLARKSEVNKKFVYTAQDPIALSNLVAAERNRVVALEQSVRDAMHQLRAAYEKTQKDYDVQVYRGTAAINAWFLGKTKQVLPVYTVNPPEDAPVIRQAQQLLDKAGIAVHPLTASVAGNYTSPVAWTVCGDELLITNHSGETSAVRIRNASIAEAFTSLWHMLQTH